MLSRHSIPAVTYSEKENNRARNAQNANKMRHLQNNAEVVKPRSSLSERPKRAPFATRNPNSSLGSEDGGLRRRSSASNASGTIEGGRERPSKKVFKVLVVGNSKCGKSSIIRRFAEDTFQDQYTVTVGADYSKKVVQWNDTTVRLQLWDIAGQDRFANMTRPFYRNANAAVVVCDVTRPMTFDAVREWKRDLDDKLHDAGAIPCVILANKCDLLKGMTQCIETGARIENLCSELKFDKWFITSAKHNENVDDAMNFLLDKLMAIAPKESGIETSRLASGESSLRLASSKTIDLTAATPNVKKQGCC